MKVLRFFSKVALWLFFVTSSARADGVIHVKIVSVDSTIIPSNSLFFLRQLAFIDQNNIFFYLDEYASKLSDPSCAVFYRQARINKYFQLDGQVTDHYLQNNALAATLSYKDGELNGPCVFYYKNGKIREKGDYIKNEKNGIWDYYYENSQKAKSINFTDSGMFLMECFAHNGRVLVQNGNGHFKGKVLIGTDLSHQDCDMEGDIKDGLQDGEWRIYNRFLNRPVNVEIFSSGRFERGKSYALINSKEYYEDYFSQFESVALYKNLDHYTQNEMFCYALWKSIVSVPLFRSSKILSELDMGFNSILRRNHSSGYSGWVFVDVKFDKNGNITEPYVCLSHENDEFEKDIRYLLDHLEKEDPIIIRNIKTPAEKFCIILVDSSQVVIPELLLAKQRSLLPSKDSIIQVTHFNDTMKCVQVLDTLSGMQIVRNPEVKAEFKGGDKGLEEYIKKHFQYDHYEIKRFNALPFEVIVEPDGSVSHIHLVFNPGVSDAIIAQAGSFIKQIPKLSPAKCNNEPVAVKVSVLIPVFPSKFN